MSSILAPSQPHFSAFPVRRKTMTITQTYFLAHKARAKLSREAARADHDLRLLVGHANMLDALMLDLADAEREQESWFNQSVKAAPAAASTSDRHVRWADAAAEEEVSSDDDSSDSDSDYDDAEDEDFEMADAVLASRRTPAKPVATLQSTQIPQLRLHAAEEDDDDMHEEDDEDFAHLALTRSPSHSATSSPPELLLDHDSDSSSDDESMPPSPPSNALPSFEDKKSAVASTRYLDDASSASAADKDDFYEQGFYLPPRNPARLVSAISVY